jgi:hypothetical protein
MTATSERVQQHRQRLRRAGLRPTQLWVPDTRSPGFAEECRRQSAVQTVPRDKVGGAIGHLPDDTMLRFERD